MTTTISQRMDVFFKAQEGIGPDDYTCSYVNIERSWDGSLLAETNCKAFAGPRRRIVITGRGVNATIRCEGELVNCGPRDEDCRLLEEGHQD